MRFSSSGFVKGGVIALLVGLLALVGMRFFGFMGESESRDDPVVLARAAAEALEAVKNRKPGERRPASYDSVLAPLDKLLAQAKAVLESDEYNPVGDFEKVRAAANPVIDLATRADAQAKTETGPLTKDYRFNDQKAEACQYLAVAMWERIQARQPASTRPLESAPPLPFHELEDIRRVIALGLDVQPGNRDLWYISGVVNRAEGLFGPAARDLERAIAIDSEYAAAWNTLGLVRISLKEFELAEDALERAKNLAADQARRFNAPLGAEYASTIYNLAAFHDNLAAFYNRENRISPTVESRRLLSRHVDAARTYLEEFLRLEPPNTPDAREAQDKLNALPR